MFKTGEQVYAAHRIDNDPEGRDSRYAEKGEQGAVAKVLVPGVYLVYFDDVFSTLACLEDDLTSGKSSSINKSPVEDSVDKSAEVIPAEAFVESIEPTDTHSIANRMLSIITNTPNQTAGNKTLSTALGLTPDSSAYLAAKASLLEQGVVVLGKGKGGSLRLATYPEPEALTTTGTPS